MSLLSLLLHSNSGESAYIFTTYLQNSAFYKNSCTFHATVTVLCKTKQIHLVTLATIEYANWGPDID